MKSRVKTYTRKEMEWLCEEVMPEIENCINTNGMIFVIALIRHAGWKKKRINEFLDTLNETMDEYHQHEIDGVFDIRVQEELESAGLDMDQILPESKPFKQQLRKSQNEKKAHIDYSEAKQLHENMTAFQNYISSKEC